MHDLWDKKYCPQIVEQVFGCREQIKTIMKWLENYKNQVEKIDIKKKIKSSLIITGSHGVGKSCVTRAILKTLKYSIREISIERIKTIEKKNIKESLNRVVKKKNLQDIMDREKKAGTIILIDELEQIISSNDKAIILSMIKNNHLVSNCPIILISYIQHSKFLSEIKKNAIEIKFEKPSITDQINLVKHIAEEENLNIVGLSTGNTSVAYQIVEHSQKDYRRLLITLQHLKNMFGSQTITLFTFNQYCKTTKKKDEEVSIFTIANTILQKYTSIPECLRLYETDKVTLPLMINQHYIDCLNKKNLNNKLKIAQIIADGFSKGDIIEDSIYNNQNWILHGAHGFYTCVVPSYHLRTKIQVPIEIKYPSDINRSFSGVSNKKNLISVNDFFCNKNINDYIYINTIIQKLVKNDDFEELIKIMKSYKMSISNLDSILKIDKIKSSKINLTNRQKKILLEQLKE